MLHEQAMHYHDFPTITLMNDTPGLPHSSSMACRLNLQIATTSTVKNFTIVLITTYILLFKSYYILDCCSMHCNRIDHYQCLDWRKDWPVLAMRMPLAKLHARKRTGGMLSELS